MNFAMHCFVWQWQKNFEFEMVEPTVFFMKGNNCTALNSFKYLLHFMVIIQYELIIN